MGGTERQVTHLVRGLAHDFDVVLACTHHDGALIGDARRVAAHVHMMEGRGGWDFRLRWWLAHLFRMHRPDIVHTFLFGFDLFANLAARSAGAPVVISSRRELPTWMKRRHLAMQRMANKYVDCIVANSHAAAEYARVNERIDGAHMRIIYNGVDADEFVSPIDAKTIRMRYRVPFHRHVIGIVANFSPVKDHFLFLDAAAELLRRRADVHFLLVGKGPLERDIRARAEKLRLSDCCTFVSTVTELRDLYALMDVSVLCSRVEGFPNAVIESMAAGKAVVAAAVGGIPEMIRDGDTGFLIDNREPARYADAIERALDHPDDSAAMGARAAAYVRKEFAVERMLDAYRRLYAELLEKRRK
jgi:glycosyltransferase involved in cell wall biosynthesis